MKQLSVVLTFLFLTLWVNGCGGPYRPPSSGVSGLPMCTSGSTTLGRTGGCTIRCPYNRIGKPNEIWFPRKPTIKEYCKSCNDTKICLLYQR